MIEAPVGHHCPACVEEARGSMRRVSRVRFTRGGTVAAGPVVLALVATNVAMFLVDVADPSLTLRFADNAVLVARGEYHRMLTAAFLHAGLLHLAFNMFALWLFGSQVERVLGPARFLALYLLAAVGGSALSHFFGPPTTFGVGASGAVFGILGAYVAIARSRGLDTSQVTGLIVLNLFVGAVLPGIDNAAHVGGLLTGAAVAAAYEYAGRLRGTAAVAVQAGALAAVAATIVVATVVRVDQLVV
jgi:membrane associated rhomboid family serine protease